jgi:hypothetical protein
MDGPPDYVDSDEEQQQQSQMPPKEDVEELLRDEDEEERMEVDAGTYTGAGTGGGLTAESGSAPTLQRLVVRQRAAATHRPLSCRHHHHRRHHRRQHHHQLENRL